MNKDRFKIIAVLIFLSLFLIFLDRFGKLDFITFPMRRVFAPVQNLYNDVFELVIAPYQFVKFVRLGEERIKQLEKKNLELSYALQENLSLKEENSNLRKQLGTDFSKFHVLLPAKVLGISRLMEIETIDNTRVKVGQAVVYLGNYVGKIEKTGWGIAYVQLATDPSSKVAAKTPNAAGIVTGEFSSGVTFDKIAKSETISEDDLVVTSGLGGAIPQGLILGKVLKIKQSNDELFSQALIETQVDIRKLTMVYIVMD